MGLLSIMLCCLGLLMLTCPSNALSCNERYGKNCYSCNEEECTGCYKGYCGSVCSDHCTGFCKYDCHKNTCSCTACADGYYGVNCSCSCSGRCYKVAEDASAHCQRNGACSNGCEKGFCLPDTACSIRCSHCVDDDCDSDTCKCRNGSKPGFESCDEKPKVPSVACENCRDQKDCRERGGECIDCEDGYHGEHCEKKCTNCDICYQLDGECIPQNKHVLAWCWSYAGFVTLVCIVFGVLFLWYCLKNRHKYGTPGSH